MRSYDGQSIATRDVAYGKFKHLVLLGYYHSKSARRRSCVRTGARRMAAPVFPGGSRARLRGLDAAQAT
jgi:hypothetical protein